jgi:caffeic acid 3-O-methyltransferase / acetylserotonin O-methyltransferase
MDHITGIVHSMPEKMNSVDDDACMLAWQLTTASILPMTLKAALELDLLEILVAGCGGLLGEPIMTAADVASHLKARNPQVSI